MNVLFCTNNGEPVKMMTFSCPAGVDEPNEAMVCEPVIRRAACGTEPRSVVDALTRLGSVPPPIGGIHIPAAESSLATGTHALADATQMLRVQVVPELGVFSQSVPEFGAEGALAPAFMRWRALMSFAAAPKFWRMGAAL
jgi:hypothetical protein